MQIYVQFKKLHHQKLFVVTAFRPISWHPMSDDDNDDYTKHLIDWVVLIRVVFMTCHAEPSAI